MHSAPSFNVEAPTDKLSIAQGEPKSYKETGSSGKTVTRNFCSDCGTPLYTVTEAMPGVAFVKVGSLGEFGKKIKLTSEAWTENANPNTLR